MRATSRPASIPPELRAASVSDREFRLFQELILRASGIHLQDHKRALLAGRLARRLRELGVESFGEYYTRVMEGGPAELTYLLDAICTNETHFFREPDHFAFLAEVVLPELEARAAAGRRQRGLRVWSAACSTGEEPYTIAMVIRDYFPKESAWPVEIIASDLSTRALRATESATWPIQRSTEIPPESLRRFMLRGTGTQIGKMRACAELRGVVRTQQINLNDDSYAVPGAFDLIFCRNVLIYFDAPTKEQVIGRLLRRLNPGGYLFLGHAETLSGIADRMQCAIPNVYRLRSEGGGSGRASAHPAVGSSR